MSTEESPLLGDQLQPNTHTPHGAVPTEDVYDRFDRGQKRVILAIASITGLLPSVSCILIRLFFFVLKWFDQCSSVDVLSRRYLKSLRTSIRHPRPLGMSGIYTVGFHENDAPIVWA